MIDFLGIARERMYSPGKVADDRAILEAVAERLAATHRVAVVSADDALPEVEAPTVVFAMCQGPAALATLRRWQAAGVRVINSVAGIENAHRQRMLAAFAHHGVAHPESILLASDDPGPLPEWLGGGAWLKRGDVHATEPDDVVRVADGATARSALAAFARRGIASALLQRHVAGEVIKFYALRGRAYFACFAAGGGQMRLSTRVEGALQGLAEAGAAALELEVFGGDCVCDSQENLSLIDLNDWPSYGRCRPGAAEAIASYLRQARSQ